MLPSSMATICGAIVEGDRDLQLPLTVNCRRQMLPLSTLCSLEPFQVHLASPILCTLDRLQTQHSTLIFEGSQGMWLR